MKEEALKLADDLEKGLCNLNNIDFEKASAMIRRLVEELDKATYVLHPKIRNTEAEEVYDDLCMSWQADMENGVKWLNEKAVEDFKKKYPELNKSISRTMQFLWAIAEGGEPQTKPTITKADGKVVAVTMTDDEHRVHEVLWEAPKPLSDDEIHDIWKSLWEGGNIGHIAYNYAKAIEERHGIK